MQLLALLSLGLSSLTTSVVETNAPMREVSATSHFDAPSLGAPSAGGVFIPIHKPSHFQFVVIVPDDGKDGAGGWQAAKANLPFQKFDFPALITWYCTLTIQVPIRHSVRGGDLSSQCSGNERCSDEQRCQPHEFRPSARGFLYQM